MTPLALNERAGFVLFGKHSVCHLAELILQMLFAIWQSLQRAHFAKMAHPLLNLVRLNILSLIFSSDKCMGH